MLPPCCRVAEWQTGCRSLGEASVFVTVAAAVRGWGHHTVTSPMALRSLGPGKLILTLTRDASADGSPRP